MYFSTKKCILQQKRLGLDLDIGQNCTFGMNKKEKKLIDDVLSALSQILPSIPYNY